jgi:hypothetical protein
MSAAVRLELHRRVTILLHLGMDNFARPIEVTLFHQARARLFPHLRAWSTARLMAR